MRFVLTTCFVISLCVLLVIFVYPIFIIHKVPEQDKKVFSTLMILTIKILIGEKI
jgi:hypothetical protein